MHRQGPHTRTPMATTFPLRREMPYQKSRIEAEGGEKFTLIVNDRDTPDRITIDRDSPLAGQGLAFNVKLKEIVS